MSYVDVGIGIWRCEIFGEIEEKFWRDNSGNNLAKQKRGRDVEHEALVPPPASSPFGGRCDGGLDGVSRQDRIHGRIGREIDAQGF